MTTEDLRRALLEQLQARYEASEAAAIGRIVLEDAFEYRNGSEPRAISAEEEILFRHILQRLRRGEPVQYIMGEADFYGLKLLVDRRVLIPRQETEELVHWVLATWKDAGKPEGLRVLDIGTGSGCIPIALKKEAPAVQLWGLDVDADALALAAENAARNEVSVEWIQMDILDQDQWDRLSGFDFIISNPPYIPPSQRHLMPEHVLAHEPERALFAPEDDPLVFYREIGLLAYRQLAEGGYLFLEANEYNAPRAAGLLEDIGFRAVKLQRDLAGKERMLRAVR